MAVRAALWLFIHDLSSSRGRCCGLLVLEVVGEAHLGWPSVFTIVGWLILLFGDADETERKNRQ